jgi:AbrB family looped-hinge helix DNA binding protein
MTTKNVTVTTKNQITIPAEYVRSLHLAQGRVLRVELHGGTIVLTPQPALGDTMRQFWGKHKAKRPLTDEEIKQAVRSRAARVTKNT